MKNYDQATKLWTDALGLGPSDEDVALIRNNMAACHMVKKRYNMAVQECSVALSKQPDYVKALMRRGKAYESMKDYVKAAGDYEKAARLGSADGRQGLARVRKSAAGLGGAGAKQQKQQAEMASSMKSLLDQFAKMGGSGAGAQQQQQDGEATADAWLVQFVHLLRKYYGCDVERTIVEGEIANDKVNAAMHEMMKADAEDSERVEMLLGQAGLKFKEQAAFGMAGEANVKEILVDRIVQRAVREGRDVGSVMEGAAPLLEASDALLGDAIAYCPPKTAAMVDLMITQSQSYLRRASLAANYVVETVPVPDADGTSKEADADADAEEKQKAALDAAFRRITDDAKAFEAVNSWLDKAVSTLEEALAHMPGEDSELSDVPVEQLRNNLMITMGNTYYEASILRAGGGLEWRGDVERAKASFEEGQASPAEIRNALLGHVKASDMMDLVGEEIPVVEGKAAESANVAGKAGAALEAAEGPKGLPSLPGKRKKASK